MFINIDHRQLQLQQDAELYQQQQAQAARLNLEQQQRCAAAQVQPAPAPQIIERQAPTLIPHDHPSELPPQGAPYGGVLTSTAIGLVWQPLRTHADAYARIESLERACLRLQKENDMNNRDKQATIDRLNAYWLDKHPDCFIDLHDGRSVFRQELLDYKHDLLLTDLYNRKPIEAAKPKQWPLWLAFAGLFLMEIAHVVIH